jgi:hypothetical protein
VLDLVDHLRQLVHAFTTIVRVAVCVPKQGDNP